MKVVCHNQWGLAEENAKIHLIKSETMSGLSELSEGDIGVYSIGQFFLRYFSNLYLKMRYCQNLQDAFVYGQP